MGSEKTRYRRVWSNRPGEEFESVKAAADAVGKSPSLIFSAIDHATRTAAGRRWTSTPPAWWHERQAQREAERVAGVVVRTYGRQHAGPPLAWRGSSAA